MPTESAFLEAAQALVDEEAIVSELQELLRRGRGAIPIQNSLLEQTVDEAYTNIIEKASSAADGINSLVGQLRGRAVVCHDYTIVYNEYLRALEEWNSLSDDDKAGRTPPVCPPKPYPWVDVG